MEDQAGLKLFSLDAPQRYSGAVSRSRMSQAQRLGGEDVPTNNRVSARVSLSSDDASLGSVGEDTLSNVISEEGTFDVDDCSQRALWKRWSTMARLDVSQVEEESLHNSCLCTNLFACMDVDQAKELYELGTVVCMSPGDVLLRKGDSVAPGIFLVLAGEVGEYSTYSSSKLQCAQILKKGDVVAEDHIDLILDEKGNGKYCTSFQIVDTTPCELLQLSQSVLSSFFSRHPSALLRYIQDVMVCRYTVANTVLRQELEIRQDELTAGRDASALSAKHYRLLQGLCADIAQKNGSIYRGICKILRDDTLHEDLSLQCLETEVSPLTGWDVIPGALNMLHDLPEHSMVVESHKLVEFHVDECFLLTEGMLVAFKNSCDSEHDIECAVVTQGSLINAATFLTSEHDRVVYYAGSQCKFKRLDQFWLGSLMSGQNQKSRSAESLATLTQLFGPTLRQFQALGFQHEWLSAGQAAFRQDQDPDGFFMVVSGSMKFLQLAVDGSLQEKGMIRREEWVGTTTSQPYAFSCMAMRDVELVSLKRNMLQLLSRIQPRALLLVYDKVMQKMERSTKDSKTSSRTITVISGGTPVSHNAFDELQQDADDFGGSLEHALSSYGSTCRIDWGVVVQKFPEDSKSLHIPFYRAKVTRWLCSMEEEHTFLLLVGDCTNSDWTTLCSAQADCVLILGSSMKANPEISTVENESIWKPAKVAIATLKQNVTRHDMNSRKALRSSISVILSGKTAAPIASKLHQPQRSLTENSRQSLGSMCQIDLVLVHNSESTPSNAKSWLNSRPLVERHYNIRKSNHEDVERIARWVSGNAIGVVLSGGGARGLAHVGVLQALETLQIPIDAIGGTSQGSLVAALYAQGHSAGSIGKAISKYASVCGSVLCMVLDLTLPILSVFNGKRFQQAVKTTLSDGAQNIEDLLTSFFCVTTNLSTGEPHIHTRGVLWRAVRASMSIVGLVPPIIDENGHLICDGGYSDNLPVDAMRKMGASVIIAVDVEDRDVSAWSNLAMPVEGVLSGWQIMWDRWCPIPSWTSGQRFPRQQHMLNALCGMAHSQNLANLARFVQEKHIDLYLRPPVLQYALLDWKFMEDIVSDSRSYSLTEISKWQKNVKIAHYCHSH
jgi:predicted acylesterase/phospholipase RssA/CRP-like cAMP-binding protein